MKIQRPVAETSELVFVVFPRTLSPRLSIFWITNCTYKRVSPWPLVSLRSWLGRRSNSVPQPLSCSPGSPSHLALPGGKLESYCVSTQSMLTTRHLGLDCGLVPHTKWNAISNNTRQLHPQIVCRCSLAFYARLWIFRCEPGLLWILSHLKW